MRQKYFLELQKKPGLATGLTNKEYDFQQNNSFTYKGKALSYTKQLEETFGVQRAKKH